MWLLSYCNNHLKNQILLFYNLLLKDSKLLWPLQRSRTSVYIYVEKVRGSECKSKRVKKLLCPITYSEIAFWQSTFLVTWFSRSVIFKLCFHDHMHAVSSMYHRFPRTIVRMVNTTLSHSVSSINHQTDIENIIGITWILYNSNCICIWKF